MPSSSDNNNAAADGTPNRRRRSGSRGRAKVSITTTTTTATSTTDGGDPSAVLTPASSSSDIRQVRTVRTGDTTVPTGAHSRGTGAANSTAHLTAGLGSPTSDDERTAHSYHSMGAGTQATATAGGLLYSALGTIKEWTNDIANDLMVAAVDNSNDADAGNGPSASGQHHAVDRDGSAGSDKKKTSSPGRKLRAVVRSLSPNSRRNKQQQEQQPVKVSGTNPCGPAMSQVMEEFVAATAMEDTNNSNKPMSKMKHKLARSSGRGTSNKAMGSPSRNVSGSGRTITKANDEAAEGHNQRQNEYSIDGELIGIRHDENYMVGGGGGGDSTVVARTNQRNDNNTQKKQNIKITGSSETNQSNSGKPQVIGPVQFLQHMMSANCMATTGLAELGFGDSDIDGSYSDESYSDDDDESEYSDNTGQSSGRNRRSGGGKGRGRSRGPKYSQGQDVYTSSRHRSGRRGGVGQRGRRGSSTLSGRPEDIPEGDEDENSMVARSSATEEDLDVIGRLPGGVVRDKGGTPKQHNRKFVQTTKGEESDLTYLRHFSKQITEKGFQLIWHRVQDSKLQMEPTDITTFLMLDEESSDPCLTWDIYDDPKGRSKNVTARGSIPLFDIASVEKAETKHLQAYPFAIPSHSFFVTLSNGGVILFEAKDESQHQLFIRGLRWVVARLAFNLIVGNGNICTELGLIARDALEEDVDSAMDGVTNRLVDVSVQTVRANSMMKT